MTALARAKSVLRKTWGWRVYTRSRDALERRFGVIYNPRQYWEAKAEDYIRERLRERLGRDTEERELRWVLARVASYRPRRVVEVGCAFGRTLRRLAEHARAQAIGIDLSARMLWEAREFTEGAAFLVQGTARALPLRDQSADVVCTYGLLMHVPPGEIQQVVRELCRIARTAVVCLETATPLTAQRSQVRYGQVNSRTFGYDYQALFEEQEMICVHDERIGTRVCLDFRKH